MRIHANVLKHLNQNKRRYLPAAAKIVYLGKTPNMLRARHGWTVYGELAASPSSRVLTRTTLPPMALARVLTRGLSAGAVVGRYKTVHGGAQSIEIQWGQHVGRLQSYLERRTPGMRGTPFVDSVGPRRRLEMSPRGRSPDKFLTRTPFSMWWMNKESTQRSTQVQAALRLKAYS